MTSDTRKDKRAKIVSLTVRYKSATVDEFIDNHSFDVSMGGVFVKTPTPFAPGTLLKFELHIADDQTVIAGVGRVVWKREPTQAGGDRPAGMGVKFIKIDDASRQIIDRLVKENADAGAAFTSVPEEAPVAAQPAPAPKPAAAKPAPAPAPKPAPAAAPAPKPAPAAAAPAPKPAPAPVAAKPAPAPAAPAAKPILPAPKPATSAAAAASNLKATLPVGSAPVPKPSAPPPRAAAPGAPAAAPPPPRAPKVETTPEPVPVAQQKSDSIRAMDPRRQTVAGLGIPLGLASQGKDPPNAASTQPLGSLSDDDEAFKFLDDLEQKEPAPLTPVVAAPGPTSKSYPSPFDAEPATMAKPSRADEDPWAQTLMDSPKKPSPDESSSYSATQPLAKSALPDFDAAINAAAGLPIERPTLPRNKDFESTMPLDRASLGLPAEFPKAGAAMFPRENPAPSGGAMFPKTTSGPSSFDGDRPEPTVMKQAAELLEEALREAGGSLDEIGHNPLFQNAGMKAEGPTVAQGPSDDLLAAVRGNDGPNHDDPTVHRIGETPTVPAFTPEVPPRASGTPAPPQVALARANAAPAQDFGTLPPEQPLSTEDQVRPLPVSKKRSGGGGLAVVGVLFVTLLAGGGVWAYKTHAFGIGAPPEQAPPTPTVSAPAPSASAPTADTPEAGAAEEAGTVAAGGDAGPTSSDAGPATVDAGSANAAAAASASAAPSASAPKPKPVYHPPPPPPPSATTEPTTTPTEPKPPSLDPKPDPKPTDTPKPVDPPKPTEAPKPDPKPAEVN